MTPPLKLVMELRYFVVKDSFRISWY